MTTPQPHDGAQSQLDDSATEQPTAQPTTGSTTVSPHPPVPVSGRPTADSTSPGTAPPGVQAASPRQPAVAVPGKPDGEVDTRR